MVPLAVTRAGDRALEPLIDYFTTALMADFSKDKAQRFRL